ncbi:MAG: Sialic acid-specific 9-O-acetylesterase [Fibrobacteres bacterium]|nr:Sialic acid-specific 9-O-acetylesterase [Fibrobacterota bacterium]
MMRPFNAGLGILIALNLAASRPAHALSFGGLCFGDHMVLQRNMSVPVWGNALPNETVTVTFNGQTRQGKAGADGKWMVRLDPMPAGGPFILRARGLDSLVLKDVMVGEVWVGSGQSNMEGTLEAMGGANLDSARAADVPDLRVFTMWGDKTWRRCDSTAAKSTSATAYFFAKNLQAALKIPVGMIVSAVGGTAVEQWIDTATVHADASFKGDSLAGGGFQSMITPIIPMAIRGVIWYQGESNTGSDSTVRWSYLNYRRRFGQLIPGWRKAWGQGDFPFLFVQLPEHHALQTAPVEISPFAEVREGQRLNLSQPNTAMAVTLGLGDALDIHPRNKAPVGKRLSLCALGLAYGRADVTYSGPLYESMKVEGGVIRLRFRFAESGLMAQGGGKLAGFSIAGADRKWVWADAVARGDTVIVSSAQVPAPVEVRYAWADNPVFNLQNGAGLPASPFRTSGPQLPVGLAARPSARPSVRHGGLRPVGGLPERIDASGRARKVSDGSMGRGNGIQADRPLGSRQ